MLAAENFQVLEVRKGMVKIFFNSCVKVSYFFDRKYLLCVVAGCCCLYVLLLAAILCSL